MKKQLNEVKQLQKLAGLLKENSGQSKAVNIVQSAINSGEHINNVSYEEYLLPLAEYLDTYAPDGRSMGDLEFSPKTFAAFSSLVDSMNEDMKKSAENY